MTGFVEDRTSGSGDVALSFLRDLEVWAGVDTSKSAPALRVSLLGWLKIAQRSQPSMALVHQLAARALEVADAGVAREDSPADLRAHLAQSCEAEREDLLASRAAVAGTALELLQGSEQWVATLSHSSMVLAALQRAQSLGRKPRALIGEGRPLMEGRRLAADLAAAEIPVWLVADAALPLLLSQVHMVWLGADAMTDRGVINKIGSYAAALAAREHSVPVYALAGRRKFIPAVTRALKIAEMPPQEIWDVPAAGVRPRNIYFELVPMELLRGVVVEDGVLAAGEAATVARERALPDELAGE